MNGPWILAEGPDGRHVVTGDDDEPIDEIIMRALSEHPRTEFLYLTPRELSMAAAAMASRYSASGWSEIAGPCGVVRLRPFIGDGLDFDSAVHVDWESAHA